MLSQTYPLFFLRALALFAILDYVNLTKILDYLKRRFGFQATLEKHQATRLQRPDFPEKAKFTS